MCEVVTCLVNEVDVRVFARNRLHDEKATDAQRKLYGRCPLSTTNRWPFTVHHSLITNHWSLINRLRENTCRWVYDSYSHHSTHTRPVAYDHWSVEPRKRTFYTNSLTVCFWFLDSYPWFVLCCAVLCSSSDMQAGLCEVRGTYRIPYLATHTTTVYPVHSYTNCTPYLVPSYLATYLCFFLRVLITYPCLL